MRRLGRKPHRPLALVFEGALPQHLQLSSQRVLLGRIRCQALSRFRDLLCKPRHLCLHGGLIPLQLLDPARAARPGVCGTFIRYNALHLCVYVVVTCAYMPAVLATCSCEESALRMRIVRSCRAMHAQAPGTPLGDVSKHDDPRCSASV